MSDAYSARLAGGRLPAVPRPRRRDPHNDVDAVATALADRDRGARPRRHRSVFSTDGALAPLRELHEVCRRHGALLLVDEGPRARGPGTGVGSGSEVGLAGAPDIVMTTTLSKSLAARAVCAGPVAVRDHLIDAARTFIFDTGLAPAVVGAAFAAWVGSSPNRGAAAVLRHARALAPICGVAEAPRPRWYR